MRWNKFVALVTAVDKVAHSIADAVNAFLDVGLGWGGEAEAKLLLTTAIDVKGFAGDEGDVFFSSFTQERASTEVAGEAAPEVETAVGGVDADTFRPIGVDGVEHEVTFMLVDGAQCCEVVVQEVALDDFGDGPLADGVSVEIEDLFVQGEAFDHWLWGG